MLRGMTTTSASQGNRAGSESVICVVDDDASVRLALGRLLRSVGFQNHAFASGEEFLLSEFVGSSACLIVDVRMKGMSGFELQDALREAGSRLPIIFISAHGDKDAQERALHAGAIGFLLKPFSEDALLQLIGKALALGR